MIKNKNWKMLMMGVSGLGIQVFEIFHTKIFKNLKVEKGPDN